MPVLCLLPGFVGAVLFEMDGVVDDTAALEAAAWQRLFDEVLAEHPGAVPFDPVADYRRQLDGRAGTDGVVGFLASRGVSVPTGQPSDPPAAPTASGLANRKNDYLHAAVAAGVGAFASTLVLLEDLAAAGVPVGIVAATRDAGTILAAARATGLTRVVIDGVEAARRGLPAKPDPAMFAEAAARLGVPPAREVVIGGARGSVAAGHTRSLRPRRGDRSGRRQRKLAARGGGGRGGGRPRRGSPRER